MYDVSRRTSNVEIIKNRDPLFEEAARFIVMGRTASITSLQRRFEISRKRARRLIKQMEIVGIVDSVTDGEPRQVLLSPMDIDRLFSLSH